MVKKVKVSDYIASYISDLGVKDVFMITGGGAMHLNESFAIQPKLRYICNHHEQASAICAESYSRVTNNIGVCVVTSGPGGTNTLTGLAGAWLDSIPVLFISGQVKGETSIGKTKLRQMGIQELPIVSVVKPITKYAVLVEDPPTIAYHLQKAVYLAKHGRPGPVWLDIPLDVQSANVEIDNLTKFDPKEIKIDTDSQSKLSTNVIKTVELIKKAERPLILAGSGIRLSGAYNDFWQLAKRLNIPIVTGITAHDLVPSDDELFFGRPGIFGERVGNFVIQNCDLLISIGSRLSIWVTSFSYKAFAREAKTVMVDIDRNELRKKTLRVDVPICSDAKDFIRELQNKLKDVDLPVWDKWTFYCSRLKEKYPPVTSEMRRQKRFVNSYHFIDKLSDLLSDDEIIVVGNGTAFTCTFQCIKLKRNQRLIGNVGCASMGYDLPAAIGACFANNKKRVVCIAGDGSIQMNLQELQTIVHHRLPIKIFVLNNRGYLAIKITQDNFFKKHHVGTDSKSGVSFPNMIKVAKAYGIDAVRVENHKNISAKIKQFLDEKGPGLCEIMMDPNQPLIPKVTSYVKPDGKIISKPIEDMYPFLDREEFLENMIIKPINEE